MKRLLSLRQSLYTVRCAWYSTSPQVAIASDRSNTSASPEYVDITIAGGGLVGSAMALALGMIVFQKIQQLY